MKLLLLAAIAAGIGAAQTPDLATILARVGANQDAALEQRQNWVFHQKQLLRMNRGGGKVVREERREYVVTPKQHGIQKELISFDGKYQHNGKYVAYDKPGYTYKEMDIDGELIDDLSNDLMNDGESKDGIGKQFFPLTSKEQLKYRFHLVHTEQYRGQTVYRLAFDPAAQDAAWKGEALIDAAEFQPVFVTTKLAMKIPLGVRVLLGTNISGLGFSVTYRKFADGVWFPVSYGGEFHVRAVFFYHRNLSISMVNDDFKRTDVASNVTYASDIK
jgi:hypothetical protein